MTILVVLFGTAFLVMAFFIWQPRFLLRLYESFTGTNAGRQLGGAEESFLQLTRRLCVLPAVLSLIGTAYFTKAAIDDARTRPQREKLDQERIEKIRKYGIGGAYAQPLPGQQNPKRP